MALSKTDQKGTDAKNDKIDSASLAAVDSARSASDAAAAPHVDLAISELEELKLDIGCDMGEAIRGKGEPDVVMARLKAYEDVMGLIDIRLGDLRKSIALGVACDHCDEPREIFYTTDDDVDLCEPCYWSLRDEMTVRAPRLVATGNPASTTEIGSVPSASAKDEIIKSSEGR